VRVHGIDLSPDMVAELQAKPGTDVIGVTIGDFATTNVGGTFTLAYLVRNTITNLTTQDEQVACFRNVAAQLEPGGCFVIEVYIPQLPGPRQSAGVSGSRAGDAKQRQDSGGVAGVAAQRGGDVAVAAGVQDADGEVAHAGHGP
jgi:hypothetical protein